MKRLVCAVAAMLVMASAQVMAESPPTFTYSQSSHGGMIVPGAGSHSPYDFSHRGAGSDKSDELGVPYYHNDDAE
ncbi:multiple antibiotic resistance protein MarB [Entomohabitans teleogrylli]|uniref:multiple antibiotic resistance protein MarB n=1 Tax=Entomohabitans teleogrylli TaxID=1384589 RepID=UPI00073D7D6F|nr:multiple antibiotic resistance protein MarB [Entomohabitans teleogrylli]